MDGLASHFLFHSQDVSRLVDVCRQTLVFNDLQGTGNYQSPPAPPPALSLSSPLPLSLVGPEPCESPHLAPQGGLAKRKNHTAEGGKTEQIAGWAVAESAP